IYSKLKKNQHRAALVIPYYKSQQYSQNLQILVDKKIILDDQIKGLTNILLTHMADQNNFLIISLDTFFSNPDRNIGNILQFNEKIVCIDHGDCYADIGLGLEIIKSIKRNIIGNPQWQKCFSKYQNILREYLHKMPESSIIECLIFICSLVPKEEQIKRTKLAYIINDIKIHYFFLEYIVNIHYE
ncbi:MAG: hypothetical protein KC550_07355, partial [Nanoarchaeota archaeon]|nr:hypothetical protein [Nanoarchaeota archaeon]